MPIRGGITMARRIYRWFSLFTLLALLTGLLPADVMRAPPADPARPPKGAPATPYVPPPAPAPLTVSVQPAPALPSLILQAQAAPDPAVLGEPLTVTITVTNDADT